VVNSRISALL